MKVKLYWLFLTLLLGSAIGCSAKEEASASSAPTFSGVAMPESRQDMATEAISPPAASGDQLPSKIIEREVIRQGSATLRVDDVHKASKKVLALIKKLHGYVGSSDEQSFEESNPTMTLNARIPVNTFDSFMTEIESYGTLLARNTNAEDVTMQVVDMEARIRTMLKQEEAYRNLLGQARKMTDIMTVQEHLTQIRSQIESIQSQRKALKDQAAYSSISLTLNQSSVTSGELKDQGWLGESWSGNVASLKSGLRGLTKFVLWLFVMSPIWLPPILVIWWLIKRASRPKPPAPPIISDSQPDKE